MLLQDLDNIFSRYFNIFLWADQKNKIFTLKSYKIFCFCVIVLERSSQDRFKILVRPYQNLRSSVLFLFYIRSCKTLATFVSKSWQDITIFLYITFARSQQNLTLNFVFVIAWFTFQCVIRISIWLILIEIFEDFFYLQYLSSFMFLKYWNSCFKKKKNCIFSSIFCISYAHYCKFVVALFYFHFRSCDHSLN